jgi:phage FluMu protein Com
VPKPVPEREAKDARGYQLEQLRRRYSPKETALSNGTVSLLFNLTPSDPDFPFDLDHLECDVHVPAAYPKKAPQLHVKNTDIPRGFAINIEKGWDRLVQEKRGATLLALTNALDRNLESLLSEQKAETVKLTIFKDTRHLEAQPVGEPAKEPPKPPAQPPVVHRPYIPEESYSRDQIAEAKARRAQEVRQLEARMSRLAGYQKSSDGIIYTLPLEPKRRANLPAGLQPVQSVQLIIPLLYPLQSLRILLNDVESEDAEPVEELFSQKAAEQKQMTLTSHINYLAQNLHLLAKEAQKPAAKVPAALETRAGPDQEAKEAEHSSTVDEGKGHIHVIPRPPEWMYGAADGSDSSEEDSYDEDDDDGGAAIEPDRAEGLNLPAQTPERGTAMSFPSIELHGIELLQVAILSLNVKCDRCKTLNEVTGLKDNLEKPSSCKKCATAFTVRFRQELIHQNSTRAGFIDATGCTVADLLPRYYLSPIFLSSNNKPSNQPTQHLHPDLLQLLHPLPHGLPLRPRRHDHKHLPLLPRPLHLLPARREIPVLRPRRPRRASPHDRPAPKTGEARPARGRAAAQPRRVRALPEELPLVPLLVLRTGVSVR